MRPSSMCSIAHFKLCVLTTNNSNLNSNNNSIRLHTFRAVQKSSYSMCTRCDIKILLRSPSIWLAQLFSSLYFDRYNIYTIHTYAHTNTLNGIYDSCTPSLSNHRNLLVLKIAHENELKASSSCNIIAIMLSVISP